MLQEQQLGICRDVIALGCLPAHPGQVEPGLFGADWGAVVTSQQHYNNLAHLGEVLGKPKTLFKHAPMETPFLPVLCLSSDTWAELSPGYLGTFLLLFLPPGHAGCAATKGRAISPPRCCEEGPGELRHLSSVPWALVEACHPRGDEGLVITRLAQNICMWSQFPSSSLLGHFKPQTTSLSRRYSWQPFNYVKDCFLSMCA